MKVNLDNISIILNRPRFPENIGAAARCCRNMGIPELMVVRPENLDQERMLRMATSEAEDLIQKLVVHDSLEDALAPFNYAVGTTARTGRQRRPTDTPRTLPFRLAPLSQENRIALVFGSENWGLSNEDLRLCHFLVTIPTASFSSINLAQSVMIICYELFMAESREELFQPRIATIQEMEGMYRHLDEALRAIGFIHPRAPDYWMTNVRRFFSRLDLRSREVRLVRGFCRQLLWAVGQGRLHAQAQQEGPVTSPRTSLPSS
ncbi:MAG: RNA methyltransferase [Deltaproteobacteria bacterium]